MDRSIKRRVAKAMENNVLRILTIVPSNLMNLVVRTLLKSQGKGWGSVSINEEIRQISSLIDWRNLDFAIFDVGANVGYWSLEAAEIFPNAQIYAFEPSRHTFEVLSSATASAKRIIPLNLAIADKTGTAILYSDKELSGLASLRNRRLEHFDIHLDNSEEIETITLDQIVKQLKTIPKILKIDAEGLELEILNSGESYVTKIPIVQFEFGGSNLDSQTTFQDFWYFFADKGFEIYRITPSGPRKLINYSELDEIYLTTNFIAVRKTLGD